MGTSRVVPLSPTMDLLCVPSVLQGAEPSAATAVLRPCGVVAATSPRLLVEINWKPELVPLSHVYYSYYLCVDLILCNDLIC